LRKLSMKKFLLSGAASVASRSHRAHRELRSHQVHRELRSRQGRRPQEPSQRELPERWSQQASHRLPQATLPCRRFAPGAAAVPASGATDRAGDAAVSAGAFKSGLPAGEAAGF
jgi:hypothetical protein